MSLLSRYRLAGQQTMHRFLLLSQSPGTGKTSPTHTATTTQQKPPPRAVQTTQREQITHKPTWREAIRTGIEYISPFYEPRLSPEAQQWELRTHSLVSEARERGWERDGTIYYPATPEGQRWAIQYEQAISQHSRFATPEGQYHERHIQRGLWGDIVTASQQRFKTPIPTEETWGYKWVYLPAHGMAEKYSQKIATPYKEFVEPRLTVANIERATGIAHSPGNLTDVLHRTGQAGVGFVNIPGHLLEYGGMVPSGAAIIARSPRQIPLLAAAGVSMQVTGLAEGYRESPSRTMAELVGSYYLIKGASRAAGAISPIRFGTATVPTGRTLPTKGPYIKGAAGAAETFRVSGLYLRNPLERPIFGKTEYLQTRMLAGITHGQAAPFRPFVGSPARALQGTPIGSGYLPQTLTEWAAIRPVMETRLGRTDSLPYWRATFEARKLAAHPATRMQAVEPFGTVRPATIPEQAWPDVLRVLGKHNKDIVVYGSTTQRALLGKHTRYKLGDLDADIRQSVTRQVAQELYAPIKKYSPDIGPLKHEVSKLTPDAGRYTARLKTGEIVLDLHPHWERAWDLPRSELVTSRGIRMMPIGRTLWGKTHFFLNYQETIPGQAAVIRHYSGRFKDPADISLITRGMSAKLQTERLTWDIGGIRAEARHKLALSAADVSGTFQRYVYRHAPEGIDLLRQAQDPLRRVDLHTPTAAKFNVELGLQTKIVPTLQAPAPARASYPSPPYPAGRGTAPGYFGTAYPASRYPTPKATPGYLYPKTGAYPAYKVTPYPSTRTAPYPTPRTTPYPAPRTTTYPATKTTVYPVSTTTPYPAPKIPVYPDRAPPAYPGIRPPPVKPPVYPITSLPGTVPPGSAIRPLRDTRKLKQIRPAQALKGFAWTVKNPVPTIESVFGTIGVKSSDFSIKLPKVRL